jgi:hypothetical protein
LIFAMYSTITALRLIELSTIDHLLGALQCMV